MQTQLLRRRQLAKWIVQWTGGHTIEQDPLSIGRSTCLVTPSRSDDFQLGNVVAELIVRGNFVTGGGGGRDLSGHEG